MNRIVILLLLALPACGGGPGPGPRPADAEAAPDSVTATAGPVTLVVGVSRRELGLAEQVTLTEEVRIDEGFEAELPEFAPEELEGLGVTEIDEDPPVVEGRQTVLRRRLTLEPERSGTLRIPEREAWFHRTGEAAESSVTTKPVSIEVRPIEDPDAVALPAARAAMTEAQAGLDPGPSPWWFSLLLLPAAAVGAVLVRRRKRPAPPPRPAHEFAWEALRRLVAAELIEKGEYERFFVALSAILREYVERRFGVRAPERTTKEFLAEAAGHERLREHAARLREFLTLADRVKFARHEPEEADVQAAFDRAKEFVTATQEREAAHA